MLHSMTGFARTSIETDLGTLTWELRAVNHRYLDVQFRMPDDLRPQETALRQRVGETIKRGKVECSLNFQKRFDESNELNLNNALVNVLSQRLDDIAATLGNPAPSRPMDVLRWPGVVQPSDINLEPLFEHCDQLLQSALAEMQAMRRSEGERIMAMLDSRVQDIQAIGASVRARMPAVLDATRQKQRDRLEKLNVEADPERLEVELALIAQKLDVDEELDRLDSHLEEIRDTFAKYEPVGRRLDFLMQELNREANTLGSKSGDAETTKAAVELKVLIEQMREQIQNVE